MDKKQQSRFARILPNGQPRYLRCYDNGGETADRYTAVFSGKYTHKTGREHWYLGMSAAPFHPLGVGLHGSSPTQIDYPTYGHLGKKVKFDTLPADVKQCIMQTYLYLWDFTSENGFWLAGNGKTNGVRAEFNPEGMPRYPQEYFAD